MTKQTKSRHFTALLMGTGAALLLAILATTWLLIRFADPPTSEPQALEASSTGDKASIPAEDEVAVTAETSLQPVATVNGAVITLEMIARELAVSRFNVVQPAPPLQDDDLIRAEDEALNQLTTRQLFLQAAAQQGFSLDAETIRQRVALLYGPTDDERLKTGLAQANLTYEDLAWWVGELTLVEEFTIQVIQGDAAPEDRQRVYNDWLNAQQAQAEIITFSGDQAETPIALPGHLAPDFTLNTPDGQPISLADYRGQVVLVNFWATWCPSCIAEMPDYEAVYRRQGGDKFTVLGINLQEGEDRVAQFARGLGLSFPILLDQDGQVTIRDYQMVGMPGSVIIDRQGVIFYRHIGPMSGAVLTEKLDELGPNQ